jgi:Ankyrin repeats (3 copies)
LTAGADHAQLDSRGNSPLHWVARAGDVGAADQLLQADCSHIINAQNRYGETPLHWAMRAGIRGAAIVNRLISHGAEQGILDKNFRRAIDVAVEGFADDESSVAAMKLRCQGKAVSTELKKMYKITVAERRETRSNFLICSAQSRTLVLHHPECLEHHTKSTADWEAPDRVRTIMKRILPSSDPTGSTETSGIFPHEVTVSQEFDRASLDLLSRVHSTEYLSFVNKLSKDLERTVNESGGSSSSDADQSSWSPPPVVPFTPMVQRSMIKIDESNVKLSDNSDTSFSVGSLRAARRAAGSVQHAVDW